MWNFIYLCIMEKEYLFNFLGGGWNSVFASSLEEAKKIIQELYPERVYMKVDMNSIKLLDPNDKESFIPNPKKIRSKKK